MEAVDKVEENMEDGKATEEAAPADGRTVAVEQTQGEEAQDLEGTGVAGGLAVAASDAVDDQLDVLHRQDGEELPAS